MNTLKLYNHKLNKENSFKKGRFDYLRLLYNFILGFYIKFKLIVW